MYWGRELICGLGLVALASCGRQAELGPPLRRGVGTDSRADASASAAGSADVMGMSAVGSSPHQADPEATSAAGGAISPSAGGAISSSAGGAMTRDASVNTTSAGALPRDPADAGGSPLVASSPDAGAAEGAGGATSGASGGLDEDPSNGVETAYPPRRYGPSKMLVYSRTNGFRAQDAIREGQNMLTEIAEEYDFEASFSENNDDFTPEGLAQYEVVFFLNTSGDVLGPAEQDAFENWMIDGGAFVGTYRAANTEVDWAFYKELTGQFVSEQSLFVELDIQWTAEAANFPGVADMPSPWTFNTTWFNFDRYRQWSTGTGFQILATVELQGDTVPVSFSREFSNFRSFYVAMGHQATTFRDPLFKQFITGGLLWVVRRSSDWGQP